MAVWASVSFEKLCWVAETVENEFFGFICDEIATLEQQQPKECFLPLGMQEKGVSLKEMSGTPLPYAVSPSR